METNQHYPYPSAAWLSQLKVGPKWSHKLLQEVIRLWSPCPGNVGCDRSQDSFSDWRTYPHELRIWTFFFLSASLPASDLKLFLAVRITHFASQRRLFSAWNKRTINEIKAVRMQNQIIFAEAAGHYGISSLRFYNLLTHSACVHYCTRYVWPYCAWFRRKLIAS